VVIPTFASLLTQAQSARRQREGLPAAVGLILSMARLFLLGRTFLALALIGWGIQNFIYGDFVLGRAPAWPSGLPGQLLFAYATGGFFVAAGLALLGNVTVASFAGASAVLVFGWAVARQLAAFALHPNWGGQLTDVGKAITLFGGLLVIASASWIGPDAGNALPAQARYGALLSTIGRVCLSIFLIDSGIQHFLWAQFVATLVPAWVGHAQFWTYAAGVFLIAGGLGLLIPRTARVAAACCGLMIFLWFLMLHLPRTIALPQSKTDWLALFESLGFSGIAFAIAGSMRSERSPLAISLAATPRIADVGRSQ